MRWFILIIIYLFLGVILPLKMLPKIFVGSNKETLTNPKSYLLSKSFKIFIYSILFLVVIVVAGQIYISGIPSSTSDACTNTGGWTYTCTVDEKIPFISLLIMFIAIIIYYKLCEKEIHNIFKNVVSKVKYVIISLFLLFMVCVNLWLMLVLSGLFISTNYNSTLLEIFRLIVAFLPISIFALSTYLNLLIQKLKSNK